MKITEKMIMAFWREVVVTKEGSIVGLEKGIEAAINAQIENPVEIWESKTISAGRKSGMSHHDVWPDGEGWEIDTDLGRVGTIDAGWDRFDNHEEFYFRRKIGAFPSPHDGAPE